MRSDALCALLDGGSIRRKSREATMSTRRYPSFFHVNARVRLAELSAALGRPATLDDVTDAELDQLARDGFDLVWFLGVWQTGEAGHQSQCDLRLRWGDLSGRTWRLADRLGEAVYDRDRADLSTHGLYLDLPAWGCHVFEVQPDLASPATCPGRQVAAVPAGVLSRKITAQRV
jgi:hypothetical protein